MRSGEHWNCFPIGRHGIQLIGNIIQCRQNYRNMSFLEQEWSCGIVDILRSESKVYKLLHIGKPN